MSERIDVVSVKELQPRDRFRTFSKVCYKVEADGTIKCTSVGSTVPVHMTFPDDMKVEKITEIK